MQPKILVATRSFGSTSSRPWEILADAGLEVVKVDIGAELSEDQLIDLLTDIDAAIIGMVPISARVLESAPTLKVVSMHGVGTDHIDLVAASRLGISVANCPGANDQAVADLAIGLMIAVARKIPFVDRDLRSGKWGSYRGSELWNKTLGLVGMGRIGRAVAKRAIGFEMKVCAYDPYVTPKDVQILDVDMVSFDQVIQSADFISLHAALTDETRNMIGLPELTAMKTSAYLINTARGGLVDEVGLFKALKEGLIAGAALDVFVEEPPKNSLLLQLDNIVLTPHIGAHTAEAIERMGVMAAQNVIQALRNGEPLFPVR